MIIKDGCLCQGHAFHQYQSRILVLKVDVPVSEMTTGKSACGNKYQNCTFWKPIIPCWSSRAAGWYYSWLEDALQMKLRKGEWVEPVEPRTLAGGDVGICLCLRYWCEYGHGFNSSPNPSSQGGHCIWHHVVNGNTVMVRRDNAGMRTQATVYWWLLNKLLSIWPFMCTSGERPD